MAIIERWRERERGEKEEKELFVCASLGVLGHLKDGLKSTARDEREMSSDSTGETVRCSTVDCFSRLKEKREQVDDAGVKCYMMIDESTQ